MARNKKYNDKEFDLLQRLKYDNEKLKRQNKTLRKQLQRVDIDRYENLKNIIHKHCAEDLEEELKSEHKKLMKQWECRECEEGFLKLYTISRRDGVFYYRKCTECSNRTPTKPYTDKIEGIKDE